MASVDLSIVGKRIGHLVVLDFDYMSPTGAFFLCKCDCGTLKSIRGASLRKGVVKSCGCQQYKRRAEELTGKRFGRLYVLGFDHMSKHGQSYWLCECDCGNTTVVLRSSLLKGTTTSCGCKMREIRHDGDLTGRWFGRLYAEEYDHIDRKGNKYWMCICDCGNHILLRKSELLDGLTTSCGCEFGNPRSNITEPYDSLYEIWVNMRQRCNNVRNPAYDSYGGRGIFVCDEWDEFFENFRDWSFDNGYEPGLTLDRMDNDRGYSPENCRWVDRIAQSNNRRSSRYITYGGETHTIAEWSRIFGVNYRSLTTRLRRNDMSDFEAYFQDI